MKCQCGNCEFGFTCMVEFSKQNPGNNSYSCEWCGIYDAARPHCSKCEDWKENPTVRESVRTLH